MGNQIDSNGKDLVMRAKDGDEDAISELYNLHYAKVYSYIYRRVSDPELAEDLTADVFVRFLRSLDKFEPRRPVLAWLYTVSGNIVIDMYRKRDKITFSALDIRLAAPQKDPANAVDQYFSAQTLHGAMRFLTDDQREVIFCKYVESKTNEETAVVLNKSIGAVKSLQHRALDTMHSVLVA